MFKKESECSILLGVLINVNNSEWGAPYFSHPRLKTNQVRFLSEFRYLNNPLKRKSYPILNINEILLKL